MVRSGNPYSVGVFATGTHRLLVQNPDPTDNVQVATYHGVRLNVRISRLTPRGGGGGGFFSGRAAASGSVTTLAEFHVMLDITPRPTDFLFQLLTARLPFKEWECLTLTMDKTTDHYHQKHPVQQIWPALIKEHFGPRDDRQFRIVNTATHEFAAISGLEDVQDMAWTVTRHSIRDDERTTRGERDASWDFNTHSEQWTLDLRAKEVKAEPRRLF